MGYGVKKKRYIVLINSFSYINKRTECLRLELFDTIEEAREFKKKAESEPCITRNSKLDTSVSILEIKSTNSDTALKRLREEFPKSNVTLAY